MARAGHNSKVKAGPVNADRLKSFVERIERLEEEKAALAGDLRDIYAEVKGVGYDTKTVRKVVKLRGMDAADRAEQEALLDVYKHALGMAVELVGSGLSLREAARATGASKSSIHRALAVPAVSHDPATGEVIEINPGEGEDGTAKPVGQSSPPEAPLERGNAKPSRDGEASADERDASASSSPPESCGSTEGRAGQLLAPDCQLAGSEQSQASQTHKDRKTAGTPEMAASGTAGVESGPQDTDPLTIPPFLRRSATVQP